MGETAAGGPTGASSIGSLGADTLVVVSLLSPPPPGSLSLPGWSDVPVTVEEETRGPPPEVTRTANAMPPRVVNTISARINHAGQRRAGSLPGRDG